MCPESDLTVYICDDQQPVLDTLAAMIYELEPGLSIRTFTGMAELTSALQENHANVDAVFLDIVFDGKEQIEAATHLHHQFPDVLIVFITGHVNDYALRIFDAEPVYFLGKPFERDMVASALDAVRRRCAAAAQSVVTIRAKAGAKTLRTDSIEYCESKGRKVTMHGDFGSIEFYGKLSQLEEQLPKCFARCHQSFLVNMDRVSAVASDTVTMISGRRIPVAKRRTNAFRDAFVLYQTSKGVQGGS